MDNKWIPISERLPERRKGMLYPEVKCCSSAAICTCGKPNYRLDNDRRPLYPIYEVKIPTPPYGSKAFHLCADCLRLLQPHEK